MENNNKKEIKEFQDYLIQEALSLNKDPEKYVKELGEDGLKEAYKRFQAYKQKKAQKAAHGTKLQYIRALKELCAEDEELIYFKSGGIVDCGCVKKKEKGGEVPEKAQSAVEKFKNKIKLKKNCGGSTIIKSHRYGGDFDEVPFMQGGNAVKYNPTIHGISRTESPQLLVNQYNLQQRVREANLETNLGMLSRRAKELVGNMSVPWRVPLKAVGNWLFSPRGTNIRNLQAYYNRNRDSWDLGERFLGLKHGGSLNGIPFMLKGTIRAGIRSKAEVDRINNLNKNDAKGMFKGMISGKIVPTIPNIGRMIGSAYKGWIDPETTYITGDVPTIGGPKNPKNLIKLGTPIIKNGIKYYKDATGALKTALEILKAKGLSTIVKPPVPKQKTWFPKSHHTDHYVPKYGMGIQDELEREAYLGEQWMKNPFLNLEDFDAFNSRYYY